MATYVENSDPKYLKSSHYCYEHGDYRCSECEENAREDYRGGITNKLDTKAISLVPVDTGNNSKQSKLDQIAAYEKNLNFIKTALDYSDKKLESVKVAEIPNLMKQAQQEITVGKMNKLLSKEKSGIRLIDLVIAKIRRIK